MMKGYPPFLLVLMLSVITCLSFMPSFVSCRNSDNYSVRSRHRSLQEEEELEQIVPLKTSVYREFEDDGWYHGYVSEYDPHTGWYKVTYEDQDIIEYEYNHEFITMVQAGAEHPYQEIKKEGYHRDQPDDDTNANTSSSQPAKPSTAQDQRFPLDTRVYKKFPDGWYEGKISAYDSQTHLYTLLYKDDDTEQYHQDSMELSEYVENAAPPQRYPIGVTVYKNFGQDGDVDEWYRGAITEYHSKDNSYTIMYGDDQDDTEIISDNGKDIETIVNADYDIFEFEDAAKAETEGKEDGE